MKIVYCVFDCSGFGGTERTLAMQANYFAGRGHDVTIVTTEVPLRKEKAYTFSEKIRFINLDIRYAEVDGAISFCKLIGRIKKGRLHRQKLVELVQTLCPDILVSFYTHEMPLLPQVKENCVTVAEFHFSRPYRMIEDKILGKSFIISCFDRLKEWRKSRCINQYDAFVVLTEEDAANWSDLSNIHVIPNALPFIPERRASLQSKRVISVGRLTPQKGYKQLLSAWRIVAELHPDWILDIYGTGEEYEELMRYILNHHLEKVCCIKSPVSNIQEKYLESSIYVLSSLYEGFGIVLIEAMACGVPCVSYSCPCGPTDIIRSGEDGFLVPVGHVEELAERICQLIEDRELRLRMGRAAADNVLRFSDSEVMACWEHLFTDLLRKACQDSV